MAVTGPHFSTVTEFRDAVNIEDLRFFRVKAPVRINIARREMTFAPGDIYLFSPATYALMPQQYFEEVPGPRELLHRPYRGGDLNGRRVLVVRSGGIGDLLFIQPSLRYLKKKYPGVRFSFGTAATNMAMVAAWDWVAEVFPLPLSLSQLEQCDYFMNLFGLIEYCREAESKNAYRLFADFFGLPELSEEYLRPVMAPKKPRLRQIQKVLPRLGLRPGYVYVQIRASSINRTPPLSIFFVLFEKLLAQGLQVVICDQAADSVKMDLIVSAFGDIQRAKKSSQADRSGGLVNLSPYSHDLQDMTAIISQSGFVIAPDSSSLHIAGGLGLPFYGLFTSFPAELRVATYPHGHWNRTEHDPGICARGGRNCFLHSDAVCPCLEDQRPRCFLRQIDVDDIVATVRQYLAAGGKKLQK
ncbi:MAG: glycosyltransferase family 9 protein [Victivallales bacterium]|nr:glycosyltransferase family 9 protein [Victivallales bacterium]